MLLPDFSFLPGKDIRLGAVLPSLKDSKRPDPSRPLPAHVPAAPDEISEQHFEPWTWESSIAGGGIFLDMSVLTGVGAGLEASHGPTKSLNIQSDHVHRSTFRPSGPALASALADNTISRILKKLNRPPIYVVTGIMIAHGAQIESKKGQKHGGSAHAMIDVTATGTPIKTGVKGEIRKNDDSTLSQTITSSFILAYQLLRVRRKFMDNTVDSGQENRWALFNDDEGENRSILDEIDIDFVMDNTEWLHQGTD